MDVNSNIEFILNRANEGFRNFKEELNARFNRSSSVISGSSTSAESLVMTQPLMPLPNNYVGPDMNDFMRKWMTDEHDLLGQSIINQSRSTQSNSTEQTITMMYRNTSGMKSKSFTKKVKETTHPWLFRNKEYNKKDGEWNAARKSGNAVEVRRLEREKNRIIHAAKKNYIKSNIKASDGNRSELYKFLKFKKNDRASLPPKMNYNDEVVSGIDVAKAMAEHLASAFADGDERLYDGDEKENLYAIWTENQTGAPPIHLSEITMFDIIAAINEAKATKDPGTMGYPTSIVKRHVIKFARILLPISAGYFTLGWVPEDWSTVKLIPIPKPGNKLDVGKILTLKLECALRTRIIEAIDENPIAEELQTILFSTYPKRTSTS